VASPSASIEETDNQGGKIELTFIEGEVIMASSLVRNIHQDLRRVWGNRKKTIV